MRIGIEAQRIFRPKKHGMDMVALEMIRQLQKIDSENEYFIFVKPDEDRCWEPSENFHLVELTGSYPVWEQIKLPKKAKELKLDVLHCTSNTAPVRNSVPLIVTLHDIIFLEKNNLMTKGFTWYQKLGNVYRRWVVPAILPKAKKVITVSNFEKDRIGRQLGLKDNQLVAVYNGVGDHFKPVREENEQRRVREKYGLPDQYIFFFGNTDPKKNTPRTLRAYVDYCRENEHPLPLVIGDYARELVENLLKEHSASDLMGQFIFPGYILNTDMPAILTMADVLLYPSLRESFGIPILEGMACETPVLTSRAASMPEVAGEAALLVDPNEQKEISDGLKRLLEDQALRADLIARGVERAREFSWRNTAKSVLELYHQLK
ncbi:glycosyltransferase family 4 protein [Cryomorphaceae bacterium]|nr:glycosyltransferase family 4 protein [Cryomorphaceae bacterium]